MALLERDELFEGRSLAGWLLLLAASVFSSPKKFWNSVIFYFGFSVSSSPAFSSSLRRICIMVFPLLSGFPPIYDSDLPYVPPVVPPVVMLGLVPMRNPRDIFAAK